MSDLRIKFGELIGLEANANHCSSLLCPFYLRVNTI